MNSPKSFRLVQVADIHLGAGREFHLDNWRKVLGWIERERPDVVVANGDLIMGDPDDETDYAFAREAFARLGEIGRSEEHTSELQSH